MDPEKTANAEPEKAPQPAPEPAPAPVEPAVSELPPDDDARVCVRGAAST